MLKRFTAVVSKEGKWYVAHRVELGMASRGKKIEEAQANLQEAVELYLESFGTEDIPESTRGVVLYPLEVIIGGGDMKGSAKRKLPEIVTRDGKPVAVILDIDEYQEMLERLEDMEDLRMLEEMRKKPLQFKKLNEFLEEYHLSERQNGISGVFPRRHSIASFPASRPCLRTQGRPGAVRSQAQRTIGGSGLETIELSMRLMSLQTLSG